jgi:glycosyltransferase involved in cell wall biosynthesis
MMKTLIVDGQIWQTNALYRGMGGYAYSLIAQVAAKQPGLRLLVVLNANMPHDDARTALIKAKLPTAELHYLDLPFQPAPQSGEEERAVATLDAFVAEQVQTTAKETYFFIPALFLFDYCAVFPSATRKLLLFHDLTPLIFREDMAKYFPGHLYFPRFKTIFEADIVFTNSQTTGYDLEQYIGIDPTMLANLDGSLKAEAASAARDDSILARLGLKGKTYILMPTGGTEFKNNLRAAQAYSNMCAQLSVEVQLVVTSFFRDVEKRELHLIAPKGLIFTDNVSDAELVSLFAHCKAVLLPSLYEGLGLPVLEGVDHNKPVACSDISVFREIPHFREALYVFDPYDIEDIAEAMVRAVSAAGFELKSSFYPAILEKYNWSRSADLFIEAVETPHYFSRTVKTT